MKKHLPQKQTFKKFRPYELTYKKRIDKELLISCLITTTETKYMTNKASNNKHDWTLVKYLNAWHHNRTQKQLRH